MTKARILVVEDEVLVAEELREDLERIGHDVVGIVARGEDVVESVSRGKPDLVLMDIRLGGLVDGIEAADRMRAEFDIPVIFLTAFSDAETLERASGTMPAAYLLKPFNERELAANVSVALAASRLRGTGAGQESGGISVVDSLTLPALLLDRSGLAVYANPAALAFLAVDSLQLIKGTPLSSFVDLTPGVDPDRPVEVRTLSGRRVSAVVRLRPLEVGMRGEIGSLVVFDRMGDSERNLLERSTFEMNEAIIGSLPDSWSAGQGWAVDGFLLPCPSGSGDLHDVFPAGPDAFCFFAIDVMGHGPYASFIAWSVRDLVRKAAGIAAVAGPAAVLSRVNERFNALSFGPASAFFTIMLGLVERESGSYRMCRAGYHPPILLERGAAPRRLQSSGRAIGITAELSAEETSGELVPGSRLVLVSDGLIEAWERKSIDPMEAITAHRDLGLEAFVAAIHGELEGLVLKDDASILAIDRRA
jgi:CheY-like chemotaxis protein